MAVSESDGYLKDLRHRIKDALQVVRIQYDIMVDAVEKCKNIDFEVNYVDCIDAASNASKEIVAFQEATRKLAQLIRELDDYVKLIKK